MGFCFKYKREKLRQNSNNSFLLVEGKVYKDLMFFFSY